jgi:hypothetical protein
MKLIHKLVLSMLLAPAVLPLAAQADEPGHHGAYLHALADLRVARWLIDHRPGDNWVMGRSEQIALAEIDAASREITQLGLDVGKETPVRIAAAACMMRWRRWSAPAMTSASVKTIRAYSDCSSTPCNASRRPSTLPKMQYATLVIEH